jgi:hypothetical protein
LGLTLDPFNHDLTIGPELDVTPGDIVEMDAIGYDLSAPAPATFTLFGLALAAVIGLRRKKRNERGPTSCVQEASTRNFGQFRSSGPWVSKDPRSKHLVVLAKPDLIDNLGAAV